MQNKWEEQFKAKLAKIDGGSYELAGPYKNRHNKVFLKHKSCGNIWHAWAGDILSHGHRCPTCNRVKKTNEEFVEELLQKTGGDIVALEEYSSGMDEILFKHNVCGAEWKAKPQGILLNAYRGSNNYGCPDCSMASRLKTRSEKHKKQKLQEQQKEKRAFIGLLNEKAKIVGEYKQKGTKIKWLHCGHIEVVKPEGWVPICGVCEKEKEVKRQMNEADGQYEVLKVYIKDYYGKNKTFIKVKHVECGNTYDVGASRFIKEGLRCRPCNNIATPISNGEYVKRFYDIHSKEEYALLGNYVSNEKKIRIKHLACGNEYSTQARIPLMGHGCPSCKISKMEEMARRYFDSAGVRYQEQVSYPDCRHKAPLRFDFKVWPTRGRPFLLEMDGHFHYMDIYGAGRLQDQKTRDKIKDEYCKARKIKLVRVPYYRVDELNEILNSHCKLLKQLAMDISC